MVKVGKLASSGQFNPIGHEFSHCLLGLEKAKIIYYGKYLRNIISD